MNSPAALLEAVQVYLPGVISVVGSGGKSTFLELLASSLPGLVLLSTTTHLGKEQNRLAEHHLILDAGDQIPKASSLYSYKSVLLTGPLDQTAKWTAPSASQLRDLADLAKKEAIALIVEADGSRGKPLKAPADYEPVLATGTRAIFVVMGLSGLDKPFGPDWVQREVLFSKMTGIQPEEPIKAKHIEPILSCYCKARNHELNSFVVFNQADTLGDLPVQLPHLEKSAELAGASGTWTGSLKEILQSLS